MREGKVVATRVVVGRIPKGADRLEQLRPGEEHEADDDGSARDAGSGSDTKDRPGKKEDGQGDRCVQAGVVGRLSLGEDPGAREQRDGEDDPPTNDQRGTAPTRGGPSGRRLFDLERLLPETARLVDLERAIPRHVAVRRCR